ncbi:peptidase [Galliscardovia ingluviei]|uniref:Peptidase n=1 Tax=Galliscardovia ingluviei TaxID=1769422 RepID=A0A8J3EWZ5_9BIFI|nr:SpaH/EbpB family LPXTG-anchored major pilin [Galliscardovia ingluviei]GGI14525.1 peptidase [Galliscardovia ingluviei]
MRKARMFAAVATVAALAFTTFGVATANAKPEDGNHEEAEVTLKNGEIAANEATKVTIYKYDGTDETVKNDGLAKTIDTTKHHLVRNVTFNLIPVQVESTNSDIDLSTTAGWEAIQKLDLTKDNASKLVEGQLEGFKLNDAAKSSQKTGDNGQAEFTNPAKKLYLVTETIAQGDTPEIKLNSTDDGYNAENPWKAVTINKKTAPFFLTVPLSTSDTTGKNGWLYDIKIYPKNEVTKDTIQKHLESVSSNEMGDDGVDVTWSVSLPLGQPSSGDAYSKVELVDNLNEALTYKSVSDFKISGGNKDGSPNNDPSNLTDGGPTPDFTVKTEGQKVTIALTAAGLAKANQHVTGILTGKIVTTQTMVQTVPNDISGTIDNNPTVSTDGVNNGGGASNWATVKVQKVKAGDKNTFLPGAKFKFVDYKLKDDKTLVAGDYSKEQVEEAATIQDIPDATYTSDEEDGTFTAELFVGKDAVTSRNVCLVETQAPKGYDLPENNYKCFTLNADATEDSDTTDYTIENSQSSKLTEVLDNLPKTGAAGLVLMTLAGALLIGAGFFAVAANRRREQE